MSGHNKWSKIKHKKASEDARKSKVFSMHVKAITMESRKASGDINSPNLRAAIDRAKAVNMPADNISRAIEKGRSGGEVNLEEVIYEAYAPSGIALVIEGITDNKNRTTPEIKHLLTQNSGTLGTTGSALWAFTKSEAGWTPQALIPVSDEDKEKIENLIEALMDHDDIKNVHSNAAL
jgi:YebC/PmpR family DNA-binding regulatory protein